MFAGILAFGSERRRDGRGNINGDFSGSATGLFLDSAQDLKRRTVDGAHVPVPPQYGQGALDVRSAGA